MLYLASKRDCDGCSHKARCCPKPPGCKVPRSIYEAARDMARQIARSFEGRTSRRLRKMVEMMFTHLKRILKLDRLRLPPTPSVIESSAERKSSTPRGGFDRAQSFASFSIVRKTCEPFRPVARAMTMMPAMTKR